MNSSYKEFIEDLDQEMISMLENNQEDHIDFEFKEGGAGRLKLYYRCSGRPIGHYFKDFQNVSIIKIDNDWTIFATTYQDGKSSWVPITIELLESENKIEIRAGGYHPYRCSLSDTNFVQYRISGNKLIIKCISLPCSVHGTCCNMYGTIAFESNEANKPNCEN